MQQDFPVRGIRVQYAAVSCSNMHSLLLVRQGKKFQSLELMLLKKIG